MTKHFALTAAIFEGGLTVVAIALGWLLGQPPLRTFHLDFRHAALGIAATLPPLGLFWLCLKLPLPPLEAITRILDETLVPLMRDCRLVELAIIAALAGLGEEMLFRGVIQAAVAEEIGGPHGVWLGLVIAAVLFGLLHPITPTYAFLAGLIGLYLGWLWLAYGNLLVPVVVHAAYDFFALLYVVKMRGSAEKPQDCGPGE
jgi:membrane protease YdiL (CAAX protease family)